MNKLLDAMQTDEAHGFLAHGFKPDGFDLRDPAIRGRTLDAPAEAFVDFQVNPLPTALATAIGELDAAPDYGAAHEAICQAADAFYQLPAHLYSTVNENGELWICRKPQSSPQSAETVAETGVAEAGSGRAIRNPQS